VPLCASFFFSRTCPFSNRLPLATGPYQYSEDRQLLRFVVKFKKGTVFVLPRPFLEWFAGLLGGGGCFFLTQTAGARIRLHCLLSQHIKEAAVCYFVQDKLGCGTVFGGAWSDASKWRPQTVKWLLEDNRLVLAALMSALNGHILSLKAPDFAFLDFALSWVVLVRGTLTAEAAWVRGFFCAEGYVDLPRARNGHLATPRLRVSQKGREVLDYYTDRLGWGRLLLPGAHRRRARCWCCVTRGRLRMGGQRCQAPTPLNYLLGHPEDLPGPKLDELRIFQQYCSLWQSRHTNAVELGRIHDSWWAKNYAEKVVEAARKQKDHEFYTKQRGLETKKTT